MGRSLGRFELISALGRGGMGTVYLAQDPVIGRRVAIKEILVDPTGDAEEVDQQYGRFVHEFRSAGALSHPNIVTIYDVGQETGSYFIAMELVAGESLAALLKRTPRPVHDQSLSFAGQVADGLDHAHQQGVLHRDVKPANILVTGDDRVKLTDFGIAKLLGADISQPATVVGTPGYMSPEQVRGRPIDGRSDQFALAVLLYQMLVGLPPYKGDSMSEVIYQLLHQKPKPPSHCLSGLPTTLDQALLRGLNQDPAARYASCRELVDAVGEGLAGRPPRANLNAATLPANRFDEAVTQPVTLPTDSAIRQAAPRAAHEATPGTTPGTTPETDPETDPEAATPGAPTPSSSSPAKLQPPSTAADNRYRSAKGADRRRPLLALTAVGSVVLILLAWMLRPTSSPEAAVSEPSIADTTAGVRPDAAGTPERARGGDGRSDEGSTEGEHRADEAVAGGTAPQALASERDPAADANTSAIANPAADASMTLRITSEPTGASVWVDGTETGATTPTELAFASGQRHRLTLQLADHETAGWRFTLDELTAAQRASRTLHFPLRSAGARGTVAIAADYPVAVRVGSRRYPAASRHEIALAAGQHAIELSAPEVFLTRTFPLNLEADERTALRAPSTVRILVAAQPGNCTVAVDGRALPDAPPLDLEVVAGQHVFVYTWPDGSQRRIETRISRDGQRIFGTPP